MNRIGCSRASCCVHFEEKLNDLKFHRVSLIMRASVFLIAENDVQLITHVIYVDFYNVFLQKYNIILHFCGILPLKTSIAPGRYGAQRSYFLSPQCV
jgi:hypothetical protein